MKGRHNILYLYVVGTLVIKRGMEGGGYRKHIFCIPWYELYFFM
ncbi:Uncharacterised protein [Serratia marcescens]|nr:Uncharacterised protein [Serratia marcescens]